MNNSKSLNLLPGLDVLKFILAILIVAGHCSLFEEQPLVFDIQNRLNSVAVPLFFTISAFLFFRKVYAFNDEGKNTHEMIWHTVKRLAILFIVWYVLMLPMTYIKFFSIATPKETFFAILFNCTFRGYWFIKALLLNTLIVYLCRGIKSLLLCLTIALIIHFYCSFNYVYGFNKLLYEMKPYYSFYYHTIYFSIGAFLAKYQYKINFQRWSLYILSIGWMLLFLLGTVKWGDPIFRFLSIFFIFPIFYRLGGANLVICKILRDMSIILYMVQFVLIWLYNEGCKLWFEPDSTPYIVLQYSITRFAIILSLCIVIALLILKFEKKPHFAFLKYLH